MMPPSSDWQPASPVSPDDVSIRHHRKIVEKPKSVAKPKEIILGERERFMPAHPLSVSRPVTTVIDSANSLLYAVNGSTDFAFRYRLVARALAMGRNLSCEIVNPFSVIRPPAQDIKSTKRLLLLCHSAMVQILCQDDFLRHRDLIYDHLSSVVHLEGQEMLYDPIPVVNDAIWPGLISAIRSQGWTISQRVQEWIRVASAMPVDNYFVAGRLYSHNMTIRMEIESLEEAVAEGNLDEAKETLKIMQYPVDIIKECLEFICSGHARKYLPPHPDWNYPEKYEGMAAAIFKRVYRCQRDVDARLLLRQGDALLAVATEEVRQTDLDYFKFQAKLALDSYRAGYRVCVGYVERNFDLEDVCLVSMKRVLEQYLGVSVTGPDSILLEDVDRVLQ